MNRGGDNIAELLHELIKGTSEAQQIYSLVGTVIEVNEDERSCLVRPSNDDADVPGVRLQASIVSGQKEDGVGIYFRPKVGSYVIVTMLNAFTGYVSLFTELDGVFIDSPITQFNGGENGGLININTLITELNKTNAVINAMLTVLRGTAIPEPGNGSPSALQAALSAALGSLGLGDFTAMEDDTVTH